MQFGDNIKCSVARFITSIIVNIVPKETFLCHDRRAMNCIF